MTTLWLFGRGVGLLTQSIRAKMHIGNREGKNDRFLQSHDSFGSGHKVQILRPLAVPCCCCTSDPLNTEGGSAHRRTTLVLIGT